MGDSEPGQPTPALDQAQDATIGPASVSVLVDSEPALRGAYWRRSRLNVMLCVCSGFFNLVLLIILLARVNQNPELTAAPAQVAAPGEAARTLPPQGYARSALTGQHGMVASDVGECSAHGRDILKMGGNAVDAAIATALCVGVHNPSSSGIGGGCFVLLRMQDGTTEVPPSSRLRHRGCAEPPSTAGD
jgi:hypothetical protein